ncbi:FAD:protein FMN transferase [Sulfurimonas sp.]|nr:FAD:protein FMN transferase [Sulfurimonas sp.]
MKFLLIFFSLALLVEAKVVSRTQIIMSTFITIYTQEKDKSYIENAFNIMKDVDRSISSYNKNSVIYDLNKNLFTFKLDSYSYEALKLSQDYYKQTDGYFDISIGSITKKLYRFGEAERVPSSSELDNATVKLDGLHVDTRKACMEYGMQVDLGGMGKGFAVDKVSEYFKKVGVNDATIMASGDIRCLSTCKLHVENPFGKNSLVSFDTKNDDLGVTTSGNYNRYVESMKNNHLINPLLKKSQENFISITLISDISNSALDAYATATSVMPTQKAYEFLESIGVGYIVLQSDKRLVVSDNISKYTKNLFVNYRNEE